MTAEHSCPLCGDAAHLAPLCQVDGANVFTCATCGVDHVYPPPNAHALKAYYDRREWFEGGEKGGYENYDAQTSVDLLGTVFAPFAGQSDLSILDVGCGYGTHLVAAAKLGWKCFGVEPSAHARGVAHERLGSGALVVENVSDLIPHEFDVVLMLDVIEHLPSPYPTLYQLFSIGAITAKTLLVITTPNAGSAAARKDPAAWPFRHPASHLTHYSARALDFLLQRLHFKAPDIREVGPGGDGLFALARGSDFAEFMRERYVPGTWSKLAEYEHLPRYALAKTLAAGKTVLDFGCGTGYGAAIMANTAAGVTGLDIDAAALTWAARSHHNPRLAFRRHDDLGASLPDKSFDLVTCFEMIEHVDFETQKAAVANMARLLKDDGLLVISTPNPDVTALYGANPYHLREMNEAELKDLLGPHFAHIHILRQFVRVGVAIDNADTDARLVPGPIGAASESKTKPLAFIALCSRAPIPAVPNRVLFDQDVDYIAQFMAKEQALNKVRLDAYLQGERADNLLDQLGRVVGDLQSVTIARDKVMQENGELAYDFEAFKQESAARLNAKAHELNVKVEEIAAITTAFNAKAEEFQTLERIRRDEHGSPRFLARQLYRATRARIRVIVRNRLDRLKGARNNVQMAADNREAETDQQDEPSPASLKDYSCSLVIPTKDGGALFKRVVARLQRQTHWKDVEFIIVDSQSRDDTVAVARAAGAKCLSVAAADFNHGATRDYAISQATRNRVILLVQDAVPNDDHLIERLLEALEVDNVAGVYARQIPQPDADVITKRNLNLHLTGRAKRHVAVMRDAAAYAALPPLQRYAFCNFDNVCSALRKDVWELERFGRVNFGEDIDWSERVLKRGYKVVYEPAAAVAHSHDRPLSYEYKRTYVCHRKLYNEFGVQVTPTLYTVIYGTIHWTLRDILYIARNEPRQWAKLEMILKAPAFNLLRCVGQYRAVRDEKAGTVRSVSGV